MITCLFCNKLINLNRRKYCSTICIKRAWYLRNNPNTKSYFAKNPNFWKTETGIGLKWEKYAAKLLKAEHILFNKNGVDLNWDGKLVDVKSANLNCRKNKRGKPVKNKQKGYWTFNRGKLKPIDFFFCIALINNKSFKKFLIPDNDFPNKGAVIGWKSKYDKYIFR